MIDKKSSSAFIINYLEGFYPSFDSLDFECEDEGGGSQERLTCLDVEAVLQKGHLQDVSSES